VCTVGKVYKMSDKLVISPPSNFEHTVHVGFDAHTGEFTVSLSVDVSFYSYAWCLFTFDVSQSPDCQKCQISVTQQILSWKNFSPFMEIYLLYVFRTSVQWTHSVQTLLVRLVNITGVLRSPLISHWLFLLSSWTLYQSLVKEFFHAWKQAHL